MQRFAQLVRSVTAFVLADGVGILGAVVFSIVLARLRGPEELGIFSFSMAQALLLQLFVDANFSVTLPQEVARSGEVAQPLRHTQIAKWYLAALGIPLGIGLTYAVGRADALAPTLAAFAVAVLQSFVGSYTAALHGLGRMTTLGIIIAGSSLIGSLAGVTAVFLGWHLVVVILVQGLAIAIPAWIWLGIVLRRRQPGWSPWRLYLGDVLQQVRHQGMRCTVRSVARLLQERWYWIAFGFLTIGYMRFGVLLLGWLGAAAAAIGAYSAAQRFVVVLRMLPNAFFRVLLPQFARGDTRFGVVHAVAISLGVGAPVALAVHLLAPWLIELTFRIPEAVPMLQIMAWAFPGVMLSRVVEAYGLTVVQYQRPIVLWAGAVLGLGFLAAVLALPQWGSLAIASVYVGMETAYALGLVGMVAAWQRSSAKKLDFGKHGLQD